MNGGAMMGLYQFGHMQALLREDALPHIILGTSGLCITLSVTTKKAPPVLLNYILAPNVVVASVIVASAALSRVVKPVRLQVKDANRVVRDQAEDKDQLEDDLTCRVQVLWTIQAYCRDLRFPKIDGNSNYLIQSMFRAMYKYDLADEEALTQWREDESLDYEAGKIDAIIQVAEWFDWLLAEDSEEDLPECFGEEKGGRLGLESSVTGLWQRDKFPEVAQTRKIVVQIK